MLHLVLLSLILVASDAYLFDDPPAPCCVTNIYSGILLNIGGSLEANSSTPKINDVSYFSKYIDVFKSSSFLFLSLSLHDQETYYLPQTSVPLSARPHVCLSVRHKIVSAQCF